MSESVPGSREALFALLRQLADHATPERLAAARAAIHSGDLGPASEAFIDDGAGRPIPLLVWAASWNDLEMVELLLAGGADVDAGSERTALHAAVSAGNLELVELLLRHGATPLAQQAGESVLRAAHRHGHGPIFQLVKRATKDASERSPSAARGLATPPWERRYALRTDRGARDLRRSGEEAGKLDVLLVASDLKATARALATLVQAPRREADVAGRPVQDAARLLFLYRLKGIDWTIVPFVFEPASPWTVEHVTELAAAGSGIAPMARALADATGSRVVHVKHDEHTIYTEHGAIETHRSDATSDELAELGAFVPPMRVSTDGYHVQLELLGLVPEDVERADVVVLQELGDPAVNRTIALPTAAPAIVGAPVLLTPGLPAMVEAPPAVGSEAPPLVREPPPIVTEPAPSEAPPLVREPPPMVAGAMKSEPPPSEPPPMSEPPPIVTEGAAKNAPPPLVREPPPMVPIVTSEEEPSDAPPPGEPDTAVSAASPDDGAGGQ